MADNKRELTKAQLKELPTISMFPHLLKMESFWSKPSEEDIKREKELRKKYS